MINKQIFIMTTPYVPPHLRNIPRDTRDTRSTRDVLVKTNVINKEEVQPKPKKLTESDFPALSGVKKPHCPKQCKQSWANVVQSAIEADEKREEERLEKERLEQQKKSDEEKKKLSESDKGCHNCAVFLPNVSHLGKHFDDEDEDEDFKDITKNYNDIYYSFIHNKREYTDDYTGNPEVEDFVENDVDKDE